MKPHIDTCESCICKVKPTICEKEKILREKAEAYTKNNTFDILKGLADKLDNTESLENKTKHGQKDDALNNLSNAYNVLHSDNDSTNNSAVSFIQNMGNSLI